MTPRKPSGKAVEAVSIPAVENAMENMELPATQPLLSDSSIQRMVWTRQRQDAEDEMGLISEQKESLYRTRMHTHEEALKVCDARIEAAKRAMGRAIDDADAIMKAGVKALDERNADLEKVIAGLSAAVGASE